MSLDKDKFVPPVKRSRIAELRNNHDLAMRLQSLLDERKAEIIENAGKSWKTLTRYMRGAEIPMSVILATAESTGVSVEWLTSGTIMSTKDHEAHGRYLNIRTQWANDQMVIARQSGDAKKVKDASKFFTRCLELAGAYSRGDYMVDQYTSGDVIAIPKYDVRLSAGAGSWSDRAEQIGVEIFGKKTLEDLGLFNIEHLAAFDVSGVSMEPTIYDGALVLVETIFDDLRDGVWAFAFGNEMRIKRLRRGMKSLQVISDNPAFPMEEITAAEEDQLNLVGRVRLVRQTV
jgi:phage repressor protein C with HTH and peptisase S24 domain